MAIEHVLITSPSSSQSQETDVELENLSPEEVIINELKV
jgi:hypothetical protein